MTRRKLIAGNWKMNGNLSALAELEAMAKAGAGRAIDVAICPPFTLIASAAVSAKGIAIGAQDCHPKALGAHTGCVSASMLVEAGATLCIVGHSERRADNGETDAEVRAKAEAAIGAGMTAIVCVGETLEQRDAGQAVAVVESQLAGSLPEARDALVVAYEPVWAIGTGRTPSTADVAEDPCSDPGGGGAGCSHSLWRVGEGIECGGTALGRQCRWGIGRRCQPDSQGFRADHRGRYRACLRPDRSLRWRPVEEFARFPLHAGLISSVSKIVRTHAHIPARRPRASSAPILVVVILMQRSEGGGLGYGRQPDRPDVRPRCR